MGAETDLIPQATSKLVFKMDCFLGLEKNILLVETIGTPHKINDWLLAIYIVSLYSK